MSESAIPSNTGTLLSIQVGQPQDHFAPNPHDGQPLPWNSGIFKSPITTPLLITPEGIPGDGQSDLYNHGGPDNVILAYNADLYPHWRKILDLPDLPFGSFGENFTLAGGGISDETACIGDIWQVGPSTTNPASSNSPPLTLQISQPRQPCFKLARRLNRPQIVKLVRESSHGGWYLRVLTPGTATPGMPLTLLHRPHPDWPIAHAVQTMYNRRQNPTPARQLATLPELSTRWKDELLEL